MISFILWIRAQLIFWVFIPVAFPVVMQEGIFILVMVFAFVFGLPAIPLYYVYLRLLKTLSWNPRRVFPLIVFGNALITNVCVILLFLLFGISLKDVFREVIKAPEIFLFPSIATVLSTLSCYNSLMNYINPQPHDKIV